MPEIVGNLEQGELTLALIAIAESTSEYKITQLIAAAKRQGNYMVFSRPNLIRELVRSETTWEAPVTAVLLGEELTSTPAFILAPFQSIGELF